MPSFFFVLPSQIPLSLFFLDRRISHLLCSYSPLSLSPSLPLSLLSLSLSLSLSLPLFLPHRDLSFRSTCSKTHTHTHSKAHSSQESTHLPCAYMKPLSGKLWL